MLASPHLHVDGTWVAPVDGGTREIRNPADGTVIAKVDEAGSVDVARAVAAARRAFDAGLWSTRPKEERAGLLVRVAELLGAHRNDVARIETLDTGKTLRESYIDIDDVIAVFRYYADLVARETDRLIDTGNPAVISRVVHEPAGVCALIAPWNYPLLQMSWKIAPALAAGATTVVKPSEVTPLSTIALTRLIERAGVPAGVVNLVQGDGAVVGAALTGASDVDLISFTGGASTGVAIARQAAEHVTRVALELGGKNPHIVFADADHDSAVDAVLTGVFLHSGQVCSAGTRLIVHESIADDFVAELARRAAGIRVGPGMDPSSQTGPLVSEEHRAKVEGYVALGIAEGAELVAGGRHPNDPRLASGSYYLPTIFDRCRRDMRIVQEETFGPILTVERFATEAEAIALGNDTSYGLAAGVRTGDPDRGERVVRALRHGTVWLNDFGPYTPAAEWGGFGRSGTGRELGPSGLAEYQESKHIWHNTTPAVGGWFSAGPTTPER
ncbi:aldehyde dehydrogenase family protein [Aldersonia sp. NBC_00410]|uniref:aldehyde dehydrogenase family protein n=1 Tax=Aldersonia sp. NBC_00410 TaxID=2975954 RepID=UPI00224F79CC|nr:aldehyde dehydrogenase family protein [Aldersonia sp. NBC_00410]MCX5043840.1 aldehyde dehydrogenase family protein [Aldersonia sp. NBC_00410]